MPLVIHVPFYTVRYAKQHPHYLIIFGDNGIAKGTRGQACIRYCKNSVGIPTKQYPSMEPEAFYRDADYDRVKPVIREKFKYLKAEMRKGKTVVWPAQGIGTGLADLQNKSPRIHKYIMRQFDRLVEISSEMENLSG